MMHVQSWCFAQLQNSLLSLQRLLELPIILVHRKNMFNLSTNLSFQQRPPLVVFSLERILRLLRESK